jgi:hypothetical protein
VLFEAAERGVDADHLFDAFGGDAGERDGGFVAFVEGFVGGGGAFVELLDVLEDAALVFELGVLIGGEGGGFDLLALEAPQVEQAKLLLFGALELVEL